MNAFTNVVNVFMLLIGAVISTGENKVKNIQSSGEERYANKSFQFKCGD